MNRVEPLAVFAYAFPHRKTQDFITELVAAGFRDIWVIAAPWKKLLQSDQGAYYPKMLRQPPPHDTRTLCSNLGLNYVECAHDDVAEIGRLRDANQFRLGIISGARILKRAVIELFPEGILNIHPGKIPETSGLDLFFYTIKHRVPMGVTAHFIDPRVDAGLELFFEPTRIGPEDSPETVETNNYYSQIRALRKFLQQRDDGELSPTLVARPVKNSPMPPEEKRRVMEDFPIWRSGQYVVQQRTALFRACRDGHPEVVRAALEELPDLLEARSEEGWTPLIVAAFNQHLTIVEMLLERGANPNAAGTKGTTVLMYAKTRLLHRDHPDYSILERLLKAGADLQRCDGVGKRVIDYVTLEGDLGLADWFRTQETLS